MFGLPHVINWTISYFKAFEQKDCPVLLTIKLDVCSHRHILEKTLFVSSTEKESALQTLAFSITQFVKGFAATLPTAVYGIQSLESTFSPGSDYSNGKTHKMSSEQHMHN